jgi:hypothetical protein
MAWQQQQAQLAAFSPWLGSSESSHAVGTAGNLVLRQRLQQVSIVAAGCVFSYVWSWHVLRNLTSGHGMPGMVNERFVASACHTQACLHLACLMWGLGFWGF